MIDLELVSGYELSADTAAAAMHDVHRVAIDAFDELRMAGAHLRLAKPFTLRASRPLALLVDRVRGAMLLRGAVEVA